MGRIAFMTSLVLLLWSECTTAAIGILDTEYLKKGVVRITAASPDENQKVGTGFIVQLEPDAVYIVTAAHVVSGDAHPKVQFFTQQDVQVQATVKHSESSEDANGLALLIIRGKEIIPTGLTVLTLANASHLLGADPILVVGHPRNAGDWAILNGSVVARQGRYVTIDANIDEGTSGAPILHSGNVVGLVGEVRRYGRGVTGGSIQEYLEGHGILNKEALSSNSTAVGVPNRGSQESKSEIAREITGKDGAPMVLIPAGEFWMGSPDSVPMDDERPLHRVSLDEFYMDKYEVTNELFERFTNETNYRTFAERDGKAWAYVDNKWSQLPGAHWRKPEALDLVFNSSRDRHPVVSVTWDDANAYCRWAKKRLPTEAEWEYAARGGTETEYWWGNSTSRMKKGENLADKSLKSRFPKRKDPIITDYDDGYPGTAPVGSFQPNPWGLYDMLGNVREWTGDWYDPKYYTVSPLRNPGGPSHGDYRVWRGGSWNDPSGSMTSIRVSKREHRVHDTMGPDVGFRCAQDAK